MIKIASNLEKLAIEKSALYMVPSLEEKMLENLNASSRMPHAKRRALVNTLLGAASGAGVGALIGAPFAGIGAIPGAVVGGIGGGLIAPAILENMAAAKTPKGLELSKDPAVKEIMDNIASARYRRKLKTIAIGGGIGGLAGLPFAGVGAIPGVALGALGGAIYNRATLNPEIENILSTEEATDLKEQLQKLIQNSDKAVD